MSLQIQVIEDQIGQLMTHAASAKNGEMMIALYDLTENVRAIKASVAAPVINLTAARVTMTNSVAGNDDGVTEDIMKVSKTASPKPQYSITISGKKTEKVTAASQVTPIQAAKISGKSVSTINRMLIDGTLNGTQQENGRRSMTVQAVFDAFKLKQPVTGRRVN